MKLALAEGAAWLAKNQDSAAFLRCSNHF
jgi:hypothetical protein